MKCKKIKLISKYFDNQLNEQEVKELLAHIKICKICNEEFKTFLKIYPYIPSYEEVKTSEDFDFRLFYRLRQETEKPSIFELLLRRPLRNALIPVLGLTMIFLTFVFVPKSCNIKNQNFSSYELYPEEEIDLTMFDLILNNYN